MTTKAKPAAKAVAKPKPKAVASWVRNHNDLSWDQRFDFKGKISHRKFVSTGDDGSPEVFVVHWEPGLVNPLHKHDQWELQYIVEGEMIVAGKKYGPGSFFHNPQNTLYGPLVAGPNGVTYLNIRPVPADRERQGMGKGSVATITQLKKKVGPKA